MGTAYFDRYQIKFIGTMAISMTRSDQMFATFSPCTRKSLVYFLSSTRMKKMKMRLISSHMFLTCETRVNGEVIWSLLQRRGSIGELHGSIPPFLKSSSHAVTASRNIKVFSSAVAYTIEHGAAQSAAADLMVSYHDNDHYNSVRNTRASKPPPPIKKIPTKVPCESTASIRGEDELCVSYETKGESAVGGEKNEKPTGAQKDKLTRKDIRKGGLCPCGSGNSYRKCCRRNEKKGIAVAHESPVVALAEVPKQEHTVENGFKVLKI
jgi:hypothetical protein